MKDFYFVNSPNLSLKKFLGLSGVSRGRITPKNPGRVRLKNGVTIFAVSDSGIIIPGQKVISIGIDNTKLIVRVENEENIGNSSETSQKIFDIKKNIKIKKIMEKIDKCILEGDIDNLDLEFEKLDKLTLSDEEFLEKLKTKAHQFEDEGDLEKALEYYRKIDFLEKRVKK